MQPKKYYSRLEAKAWPEYFAKLPKSLVEIQAFRRWLRENMVGPFKVNVTFFPTFNLAHCYIRDDDDALLFKLKWSGMLE